MLPDAGNVCGEHTHTHKHMECLSAWSFLWVSQQPPSLSENIDADFGRIFFFSCLPDDSVRGCR